MKMIRRIFDRFKKDYGGKGERQAASSLAGIRQDHRARYQFSCQFIKPGDIVLDCACGVGYGSFILSQQSQSKEIFGVDKSTSAIIFAKKYYTGNKIKYLQQDIFLTSFEDDSFDCVVSFETLEHVQGEDLVSLFYKKLKKNKLLLISTPNEEAMPFKKENFPFHIRHYTPEEFEDLLTLHGFKVEERFTQYSREDEAISEGWNGLYNFAVARKQ